MKHIVLSLAVLLFIGATIGCKSYSKYPIDKYPSVKVDTNLIGIWKMKEDTDAHNFFVIERINENNYAVSYLNRGGSNRVYENFHVYFSKISGSLFFNVPYGNYNFDTKILDEGFFFLKLVDIDKRGFDMTLAMVADPAIKDCKSSKEVSDLIAKNINNAAFYDQPLHFHKILPLMYCK